MPASSPRHYVIVVHGIGEQKQNATAYEVVHRFAEIRQGKSPGYYRSLLPATLSTQSIRRRGTGHGWSEFTGIPVDPTENTGKFDGTRATVTSGRNFRFVDLRWAHILQDLHPEYASPTEKWTAALLDRLEKAAPPGWIPLWADQLLRQLEGTAVPIKRLLALYRPALAKLIFDDVLGDIHLYGDYGRTRGHAVRHFHVVLDEIHLRDFIDWCRHEKGGSGTYQPPVYTVIAHSLGSIMSFDALVYARVKQAIREDSARPRHPCPSLPFPGYTEDATCEQETWDRLIQEIRDSSGGNAWQVIQTRYPHLTEKFPKVPPLLWRNQVQQFITLGSPIDKFHVLWFHNYFHMGLRRPQQDFPEFSQEWAAGWVEESASKPFHYNLCDEQDPVGHHLDVAQATLNYAKLFDTSIPLVYRDVVFRRYAVPGLAHIKYWSDGDLFENILREVMVQKGQPNPIRGRFLSEKFADLDGSVYRKALTWAFFRLPFAAALVTGLLLYYAFYGWKYGSFSTQHGLALALAILLWVRPDPTRAYLKEALPGKAGKLSWWDRWKPRRSILANLVAGSVEWRRILIWLSEGTATTVEEARENQVRVAFKTQGGFWNYAKWRYGVGLGVFACSAYFAVTGLGASTQKGLFDLFGSSKPAGGLGRMVAELFTILSLSYLGTMVYVAYVFQKVKNQKKG